MDVILLERIEKLGKMGDKVSVKNGYARNYLLKKKKALRATKANHEYFEKQRAQLEAYNLEKRNEAEEIQLKLDGLKVIIIRQASDGGNLYGSVTARDIVDAVLANSGLSIARSQVVLNQPIKELGLHTIVISLHPEVKASIIVNVARSTDEAKLQEEGKSIKQLRAEEEAAEAQEFNVQSLFSEDADVNFDEISPDESEGDTRES